VTVNIPKRKINFNIEGKIFEAKELSARYLLEAMQNPESDTVDNAIADAMGELSDDDLQLLGKDGKEQIYMELVKFTFKEKTTKEEREAIAKAFFMSEEEINQLSSEALVQLKKIVDSRSPKGEPGKALP